MYVSVCGVEMQVGGSGEVWTQSAKQKETGGKKRRYVCADRMIRA